MTPHETGSTATPGDPRATAPLTRTFGPQGPTLGDLSAAYLQDYQVRQFRSQSTARGRAAHLTAFFGRAARTAVLTTHQIRQYQLARRAAGAATGTINRETSALHRMCTLAVHWGWLDTVPGFPDRLRENPPRQGFFEHPEYLAVRAYLPAPWQDILDLAYYSGWRKQEILGLTWEEIDMAGGVIRLSPARSKTLVGRMLPISQPIAEALARRGARRDPDSPLVFHRDGIPVRRWRTAWRTACQAAGVPTRFLHDCRRTAARNLIRANVPERVAMLLTGHKSRAIFDRYNIIHEQELLDAGDQLVAYLAQPVPARRRPHAVGTAAPRLGCRGRLRYQIETSQGAPPPHPCSNRNARMPLLGVIAAYAFTEDACARTVQKQDRGVDGRSCITLLTDRSSATSHRAAGGTGRDHGVAVPSTAARSGDGRAPGDSVRGGRARRTRGRRDAARPRRSGPCARGRIP